MQHFEIIGGRGARQGKGLHIKYLSTDVSELYGSTTPLVATRRIGFHEKAEEISLDNRFEFQDPREWKISQYKYKDQERLGIQEFKVVPMFIFDALWRTPISVVNYGLTNTGNTVFSLRPYDGPLFADWSEFTFKLDWPNLSESMTWLYKHDPMVYLFTDGDRMFVDPQDELAFIADVWRTEETFASD